MSLDWNDESKVQIRFNDDVFKMRNDYSLKRNNFSNPNLGQFYSTD